MIFFNVYVIYVGITIIYLVFAESQNTKTDYRVKNSFINLLKKIVDRNERRMDVLKQIADLQDYVETKTRIGHTGFDEADESSEPRLDDFLLLFDDKNEAYRRANERVKQTNREIILLHANVDSTNTQLNPNGDHSEFEDNYKNNEVTENKTEDENGQVYEEKVNIMTDTEETIGVTVAGKDGNTILDDLRRTSWMYSCSKKAAKACKSACIDAQKNFCRTYSCSSRAKKRFKQECKISCDSKFKTNRYSDTE